MSLSVPVINIANWLIVHQFVANTSFIWPLGWSDYRDGFGPYGQANANYWIGLERLHLVTSINTYSLRVEIQQNGTGFWYSAEYCSFAVGDETLTNVSRARAWAVEMII